MRIAIVGTHKGFEQVLTDWLNEAGHRTDLFRKNTDSWLSYNIDGQENVPLGVDYDIAFGFNFVPDQKTHKTWGIAGAKQIYYATGRIDADFVRWDFEIAADFFSGWNAYEQAKYPNWTWLPLPFDWSGIQPVKLTTDTPLSICMATAFWDKGQGSIKTISKEIGVPFDFIYNVDWETSLQRKSNSLLTIDNFDRGGVGVTSLESMALGLPVVCWVKPEVKAALESLGGTLPILSPTMTGNEDRATKAQIMKDFLESLTIEQLIEAGQAGRKWMESYYTKDAIVAAYTNFFNSLT